jgi:hypothetical protein
MSKAWIVFGLSLLGSLLSACNEHRPTPPILAGIKCNTPDHCGAQSKLFKDRLLAKYPSGSRQSVLEHDLISIGFERRYDGLTHCTKPGERQELRVTAVGCPTYDLNWNPQHALWYWNCDGGFICLQYATVSWSSDSEGRITVLRAGYVTTEGVPRIRK